MNDLVERLRDESQRLSGHSIDRGSAEAGVASNLADAAADALEGAAVLRKVLVKEVKRLSEALAEANDVLRSTYQIAARNGAETNWTTFTARVQHVLKKQHEIIYPKEESTAL